MKVARLQRYMWLRLGALSSAAVMSLSFACASSDSVEPSANTHGIVIAPGESGRVFFIDSTNRVSAKLSLGIRAALGTAASPQMLYVAALLSDGHRQLVGVDLAARSVAWREPLTGLGGQQIIDGIEVWAPDIMTLSPDGSLLVMSFARLNGHGGVASLDLATRSHAHFAQFVPRAGLATIAPGTLFNNGAVVLTGARDSAATVRTIYFLDGSDLSVLDSIAPDALPAAVDSIEQVLPSKDGTVLFLNSVHVLARLDIRLRAVTAIVAKPVEGAIWLSADEQAIALPDGGIGPDSPGSGRVYVFDAQTMQPTGSIALPPSAGGGPRVSAGATVGAASRELYVVTGTASIGPSFPVDPAALVDIDLGAMSVAHTIPLGDWSVGRPYKY